MDEIIKIDNAIRDHIETLKKEATKLEFNVICEFSLNKEHISEIPWRTLNYPGVYLIEIKNNNTFNTFSKWLEDFKPKWEDERYVKSYTPNLKKKRIRNHHELEEWIPLYIGISKRIEGRVHEHIFKELHKTTFALKLNAREFLFTERFRLKTINCPVDHYNIILPIIESKQREKINPLIGKQ